MWPKGAALFDSPPILGVGLLRHITCWGPFPPAISTTPPSLPTSGQVLEGCAAHEAVKHRDHSSAHWRVGAIHRFFTVFVRSARWKTSSADCEPVIQQPPLYKVVHAPLLLAHVDVYYDRMAKV